KSPDIAGNMNRIKFYRCPTCGNLVTSVKEIEISCCGNKLIAVEAKSSEEKKYVPIISEFDGQFSVRFDHPMTKDDFIANIITVQYDKIMVINLFAEQEAIVTLPQIKGLRIFLITSKDGLIVL
ncbi:MAG: hypothetical protein PT936_07385, partial [Treponema sp.]|nr:hypothetical protein [Treponema sp.]